MAGVSSAMKIPAFLASRRPALKTMPSMLFLCAVLAQAACARTPDTTSMQRADDEVAPAVAAATSAGPATPLQNAKLPLVVVHKNPTCGCCENWVAHMRQAGFAVQVRDEGNLDAIKQGLGVPVGKGSCHTAEVGGYMIEGHVPAEDVRRLLAEKPDARGLVLPGMPIGSPGMEVPSGEVSPYIVELVRQDGTTAAYATHGGSTAVR